MKNILQIFNRYRERSGEERIVFQVEEALNERGSVEVHNFLADSREWAGMGGPVFPVKLWKMFSNKAVKRRLLKRIRKKEVNALMIHNVYPILSSEVYEAGREAGIPMIQFLHNYRPFSVSGSFWCGDALMDAGLKGDFWPEVKGRAWQGSFFKSFLMSAVLARFIRSEGFQAIDRWVACSDFVRDKFIEAGIAREKVVTIRHGWKSLPELPEWRDDNFYLLLARLVPEKGIREALDAWAELEKQMGGECPRLIVAGLGSEEGLVSERASQSDFIQYEGFVEGERKRQLLRKCRAALAPSVWWEPLGLVTYEAYDYGKPMLAAASGGLTETVQDGVTGFLHEPGSVEDLCQSVMKLEAMNSTARREMGAKGREWLLREADYEVWTSKLEALVCAVTEEKRSKV